MLNECGAVLNSANCTPAVSLEERPDLQIMGVDQHTDESIAAALERWCTSGCDTVPVTDAELAFFYVYSATRDGKTIRVETPLADGSYFVSGMPFRTAPMTRVLAGWPEPVVSGPHALDDFVYLLPTGSVDGAAQATRSEKVGDDRAPQYEQWFVDPSTSRVLSVVTAERVSVEGAKRNVYLPGWDQAYVYSGFSDAPLPSSLRLLAGERVVIVQGDGYTEDELVEIGRNLVPRPAGSTGWDIGGLPATTVSYGEGWTSSGAHTTVSWSDGETPVAQLHVDTGSPALASAGNPTFADVNGVVAVVSAQPDGRSTVCWQPAPGVYATLDMLGTVEATLEVARGLHGVTRQTWEGFATES
jgi:hypothetical protein